MGSYINLLPKPLLEDIVNGRCLPIIGAGFSRNARLPSGGTMPDWKELGKLFAEELRGLPDEAPLEALSAFCHESGKAKLVEKLRDFLHVDTAAPGPAHLAFADLPFKTVVTTNYDFLLEAAYAKKRTPFHVATEEDQLSTADTSHKRACIIKLHGDLNSRGERLIVTEDDYDGFLSDYPLIATYLCSLLISRTPLLIGYSAQDPDFRQIWRIIGERLGPMRRKAYALTCGATDLELARYDRRGVKVIQLPDKPSQYGSALTSLFGELDEYWAERPLDPRSVTDEASLIQVALPTDSETQLCYFAMPFTLSSFYRTAVFPIVESYGFVPADANMVPPGDNLLATLRSMIARAAVVVADITTVAGVPVPGPAYEIAVALAEKRHLIMITDEHTEIPSDRPDLLAMQYVLRPSDLDSPEVRLFLKEFEYQLKAIAEALEGPLALEPQRLLDKKEYRAAVISAMSLLELALWRKLKFETRSRGLRRLVEAAVENEFIDPMVMVPTIWRWISLRNEIVHSARTPTEKEAIQVVEGVTELLQTIGKAPAKPPNE